MTMTLVDRRRSVQLLSERTGHQLAFVGSEPHRRAFIDNVFLVGQDMDERVGGVGRDLFAVRSAQTGDVSRKLHDRHLHPVADAEERNLVGAGVLCRFDFAFDSPCPKTRRNQYRVDSRENVFDSLLFNRLAIDPAQIDTRIVGNAAVLERFPDRNIGVPVVDILSDYSDIDDMVRAFDTLDDLAPLRKIGRVYRQPEPLDDEIGKPRRLEMERNLVDRIDVLRLDHRFCFDITEERNLVLHLFRQRRAGAADQDVRLDSDFAQFDDAVLCRFRFHLAPGSDVGYQRDVNVHHAVVPDVFFELTYRFEERQPFDIPNGSADFSDQDIDVRFAVVSARSFVNARFDLVSDVRNHLHGAAEVVAAPLFFDHGAVDAAGRDARESREVDVYEPLIVPQIEVGYRAVFGHECFAVLEWVHGICIDVDVRIELLQRDSQATVTEQSAKTRGRDAFADAADDASRHENIFCHSRSPSYKRTLLRSNSCCFDPCCFGFGAFDHWHGQGRCLPRSLAAATYLR